MPLSPQRIRDTQFKSSRRGYDPGEVDAFVEEAAAALETAQNEATAMEARARAAVARLQELSQQTPDAQAAERPADQVHPTVDESETISRALLLAQRTADMTVAEAQAEADRLIAVGRDEAAKLVDESRAEARRAGESERVQVEGEVQALLARRDFLESDVDHLEQYLQAQRERITEVAAQLSDIVQRVPGGLAEMRRPLMSASAESEDGEAGKAGSDDVAPDEEESNDEQGDGDDELAEITKVAAADVDGESDRADSTPSSAPRLELDEQTDRS
jgi:DivIVA domain-containing protein